MSAVKLGTGLPEHLVGADSGALVEFLAALEEIGYSYVLVGDHVLGADLSVRPDWRPYQGRPPLYDHRTPWHEPMVLFGYLSALTSTIEFSTGILISPQRQTALLAKQAAEVDILSGGRLRLVVASGWNDVEFEALGVDFHSRGAIMEEQVELLRMLWADEVVTYQGRFHAVTAAGINPLPVRRSIPVWFGGTAPRVLDRVGRLGEGWFPHYPFFVEEQVRSDLEVVRQSALQAGRDPAAIGIEALIFFYDPRFEVPAGAQLPPESLDDCAAYAHKWKELGATHFLVSTPWAELRRSSGVDARISALRDFRDAVGSDF